MPRTIAAFFGLDGEGRRKKLKDATVVRRDLETQLKKETDPKVIEKLQKKVLDAVKTEAKCRTAMIEAYRDDNISEIEDEISDLRTQVFQLQERIGSAWDFEKPDLESDKQSILRTIERKKTSIKRLENEGKKQKEVKTKTGMATESRIIMDSDIRTLQDIVGAIHTHMQCVPSHEQPTWQQIHNTVTEQLHHAKHCHSFMTPSNGSNETQSMRMMMMCAHCGKPKRPIAGN
jgi:hypothetical protein